jgi:hypothetical protein
MTVDGGRNVYLEKRRLRENIPSASSRTAVR